METLFETQSQLKTAWEKLKSENPKLRIRNAASQLGVSEQNCLPQELEKMQFA